MFLGVAFIEVENVWSRELTALWTHELSEDFNVSRHFKGDLVFRAVAIIASEEIFIPVDFVDMVLSSSRSSIRELIKGCEMESVDVLRD